MTIAHAGYTASLGLENAVLLMVLTPSATLVLSLCFSWIVLRSRARGRHWFDLIAFQMQAHTALIEPPSSACARSGKSPKSCEMIAAAASPFTFIR